ncbi:MAG: hypothetical protein ABUK01_00910 [Leptospirales bacterium]
MAIERAKLINKIKGEVETLAGKTLTSVDEEIFKNDFLDSINVLQVIMFMETEFSISIDPFDLTLDTLGTVNRIVDYLETKLNNNNA